MGNYGKVIEYYQQSLTITSKIHEYQRWRAKHD
ncbi:hypothetical protein H6F71_26630 [Microcoleus sp. FACHB-61]|nr:hypothetical protein [Microcoleus sp. FACHB-61]